MANMIKLSEWANRNGINYQTAYRWYKAGKLPAKSILKTPTGTILVEEIQEEDVPLERSESIIMDDSIPLHTRLKHAYKYIQAQTDPRVEEDKKVLKEEPYYNKWQDNISDTEKQKILEDLQITLRDGLPTKSFPERKPKSEADALKEDLIKLNDEYNILKNDVAELMSNVFGDGNRLLERIESRYLHEITKAMKALLERSNSFEDLKKNYEEYIKATTFSTKHQFKG